MPSSALNQWTTDRMARLGEVDANCAAILVGVPLQARLAEEALRGWLALVDRKPMPM